MRWKEFESIRKVFATLKADELPLRMEWGTKKAFDEIEAQDQKVNVRILNDTEEELLIRIPPYSHTKLQPRKMGVVFLKTRQLFFKIWPKNVVLFADYKEGIETETKRGKKK
jgi:hypothetical protein